MTMRPCYYCEEYLDPHDSDTRLLDRDVGNPHVDGRVAHKDCHFMQRLMDEGVENWTRYDLYSCFVFLGLAVSEQDFARALQLTPKVTKDLLRNTHAFGFKRKA
jgi:hypothetical protein